MRSNLNMMEKRLKLYEQDMIISTLTTFIKCHKEAQKKLTNFMNEEIATSNCPCERVIFESENNITQARCK